MEHIWSVLCRLSIIDSQRNNISLIEVLEQITFVVDPDLETIDFAFPLEIVSFWQRSKLDEPEIFKTRLLVVAPEGELLNIDDEQFVYEVDLTQYQRFRSIAGFSGLSVGRNGVYRFIVQVYDESNHQWKDVASLPLEVNVNVPSGQYSA